MASSINALGLLTYLLLRVLLETFLPSFDTVNDKRTVIYVVDNGCNGLLQ